MIEMPMGPITDEVLVAYLDQTLSAAETVAIEKALGENSTLAARLERLRFDEGALRDAFSGFAAAAPADTIEKALRVIEEARTDTGEKRPVPPSRRMVAASLLGLLATGSLAYLWGRDSRPDMTNWREAVAQYHSLYSERTLAGIADGDPDVPRDLVRVGHDLGLEIRTEWLNLPDLSPRRVQALRFHGVPVAQIAFSSTKGPPVAFCIRPIDAPTSPLRSETRAELAIAHWVRDGFAFMIIGGNDQEFVMRRSQMIIDRMAS